MPGASSLACPPAGLHRACLRPALLSLDGASPSLSRFRSALRHPPRWCILRSRAGTGQLGDLPPAQRMQFVIVSFGHAFLSEGRGLCVSLGWPSLPSRHAGQGYAGQGCEKSRRGRAGSRKERTWRAKERRPRRQGIRRYSPGRPGASDCGLQSSILGGFNNDPVDPPLFMSLSTSSVAPAPDAVPSAAMPCRLGAEACLTGS